MKVQKPDAKIGVNKNLLPLYNVNTYYMRDGQEFEIFLLNQTKDVYMVKIQVNGNYISDNGLVIRPGQSVWLDCNWDDKSKFKFSTYTVDDSKETMEAIADNGKVRIEFYKESQSLYIPPISYPSYPQPNWYGNSGTTFVGGYVHTTLTCGDTFNMNADNCQFTSDVSMDSSPQQANSMRSKKLLSKKVETGRVEKGSRSDQQFNTVNMEFNSWASHVQEFHILPESAKKTIEVHELKKYCTNCGKKLHKNDNFCGKCGTKVE